MAVTDAWTLPAQPPTRGTTTYVPLGGDGWSAPFAMYVVDNAEVDMDVSGGGAFLTITMDDRYTALISYATLVVHQQTSGVDKNVKIQVLGGADVGQFYMQGLGQSIGALFAPEVAFTWSPPAVLLPGGASRSPSLRFVTANDVTGDILGASCMIYLFNNDVRQKMPIGPLLAARGPSVGTSAQGF